MDSLKTKTPDDSELPNCLTIGFSTRALAQALSDASFAVISLDAFADQDTLSSCYLCVIIENWGQLHAQPALQMALDEVAMELSSYLWAVEEQSPSNWQGDATNRTNWTSTRTIPVFLAGGTENWPWLLHELTHRPNIRLLSMPVALVDWLRSPVNLARSTSLASSSISKLIEFPTTFLPTTDGRWVHIGQRSETIELRDWLQKRSVSSGGMGVNVVDPPTPECLRSAHCEPSVLSTSLSQQVNAELPYYQARISGRDVGVSLLITRSSESQSSARAYHWIGATEAWSSQQWPGPTDFIYRGSLGPVLLTTEQQQQILLLAQQLIEDACDELQLHDEPLGWLQMDFVEDDHQQLWLLEVNPRWTAGMEVLHRSGLANMASLHAQAFEFCDPQAIPFPAIAQPEKWFGKAIYYAPTDIRLSQRTLDWLQQRMGKQFADIPASQDNDVEIPAGHPVLTILSEVDQSFSLQEARMLLLEQLHRSRLELEDYLIVKP